MSALDSNSELTELGRILARLPIDPILGKTLVFATALGFVFINGFRFFALHMCFSALTDTMEYRL